jgi:hypothetical protein
VSRKKNAGQKRARKVQARKKKQRRKVKQANVQESAALVKLMVEDDRDRDSSGISSMPIPDRRVLERDMAKALGLEGYMTDE